MTLPAYKRGMGVTTSVPPTPLFMMMLDVLFLLRELSTPGISLRYYHYQQHIQKSFTASGLEF